MKNFGLCVMLAAITVAICLSGCNSGDDNDANQKTIGFSVLTMKNPFFKDLADDVTAAAEKHGYRVLIVNAEMKEATQDRQILDFISKKVNAIILNPVNSKSVGESIKRANKAGIPVFTCDIKSLAKDADVVCHVATDNFSGGRLAAKAVMEATGNKGKVAIIDYPEVESVIKRVAGFKAELKDAGSPIEIVKILSGRGDRAISFKVTKDILTSVPDLNAIFAINDPTGLGAYAALKAEGREKDIKIISFDGMPEGRHAIKEGHIYADAVQSTRLIGEGVVDAIIKHSEGEDVPKEKLIPTTLYRKADADKDPTLRGYKAPAATTQPAASK
ncbi:MAG: substrate-binding domain-containing protein [Phycisphaerae bacterium]|jgi:ribose transport system substrate-binding protein|nr:substrate-binding domain-containing protein [Phycisphaerae bacterium]MDP7287140.1 substrate-binding domain-containing protein [Phycisphaerae bacterium]